MDSSTIGNAAQIASAVLSFAAIVIALTSARSKRNETQFTAVNRDIDNLERRVTQTENAIAHMPAKDDVHDLRLAIEALRGEVRLVSARVEPLKAISDRLQDFVLEHPKS